MAHSRYILDRSLLAPLAKYPLFYPCSGHDYSDALALFAPDIRTFWFADIEQYRDIEHLPALPLSPEYIRIERRIDEAFSVYPGDRASWDIKPMVCTERFEHKPSGKVITVHRRYGSGPWALKTLDQIGIFYYRGDSSEGSNCRWFSAWRSRVKRRRWTLADLVLDHLVDGGLIVTDGSNAEYGEYKPYFAQSHTTAVQGIQTKPFTDARGHHFECVGYAGHRYGPTLIWQVTKPAPQQTTQSHSTLSETDRRLNEADSHSRQGPLGIP